MTALAWLIPVALALGAVGLAAFLWSLKSGQFEDLAYGQRARAPEENRIAHTNLLHTRDMGRRNTPPFKKEPAPLFAAQA
jgi:cbb3-type cytochrome oxidase maturation protein